MKVLNLFSGIGGNRLNWDQMIPRVDITAIDNNELVLEEYKKLFPNDNFILVDVYSWIEKNFDDYDIIWASPPCYSHSRLGIASGKKRLPDLRLYSLIIFLMRFFKKPWVVENVEPYYKKMINIKSVKIGRHCFWSNIKLIEDFDIPKFKGNFTKPGRTVKEYLKDLENYLGFKITRRIYMNRNHSPGQIYRNCVHPIIGFNILKQLLS